MRRRPLPHRDSCPSTLSGSAGLDPSVLGSGTVRGPPLTDCRAVTFLRDAAVLCAGFAAGGTTAVVGAGSLASLPVLLAIGLPPVVANVTSAIGVLPGSVAGAYAYRRQLGPQRLLVLPLLLPTAAGGAAGALLLVVPATVFSALLPVLLTLAAALVALQPAIARAVAGRRGADPADPSGLHAGPVVLSLGLFIAVYGGYFGAAVSVMYLALLGALIGGLQASNGVKNVLTALSCGAACLVFVVRGGRGLGRRGAARRRKHRGRGPRRPPGAAPAGRAAPRGDRVGRPVHRAGRGTALACVCQPSRLRQRLVVQPADLII